MRQATLAALAALALLRPCSVSACSFDTASEYHVDPGRPVTQDAAALPAPIVEVARITRGSAGPGYSCEDAGTLLLLVRLPETSQLELLTLGVQFRVVSGANPVFNGRFPPPVTGPIEGGAKRLVFAWLDGAPESQAPLDMEVEASFVTYDGSVGPPSRFVVRSPIGSVAQPPE